MDEEKKGKLKIGIILVVVVTVAYVILRIVL